MLALALKNSILICLIVSIGYFIIDNHLSELKYDVESDKLRKKNKPTTKKSQKSSVVQEILTETKEAEEECDTKGDDKEEKEDTSESKRDNTQNMRITIDNNMKEIYSYVYGDSHAQKTLKEMYKTTKNGEVQSDNNVLCDNTEEEKYKRMCDDPIKDHHESIDYTHIQSKPISDEAVYKFVDDNI